MHFEDNINKNTFISNVNNYNNRLMSDAWCNWCMDKIGECDVAMALHLPKHLADNRTSEILKEKLRLTFKRLDHYYLGVRHQRHKHKIPRFVTVERTDGAGWHAHAALKLPLGKQGDLADIEQFKLKVTEFWTDVVGKDSQSFVKSAVYVEPITGNYIKYILKYIDRNNAQGEVDDINTTFDIQHIAS